ncbi:hypothetical protein [Marinobacter salicampi]|uniref:hypothetical protein n=1 Tax=Marinobacter salicampi TaxID=435907 RepID=UPI00140C31B4|nr:hypothetical protein [Marinobacter salicampi]
MKALITIALIFVALFVAAYAQYRMAFHTATNTQLWLGRLILLSVALAFGWAMSTTYTDVEDGAVWAVFLTAFGVAHLPAAIILWLKKQRNKQQDRS